jgi:Protein of unknown function (DUF1761)
MDRFGHALVQIAHHAYYPAIAMAGIAGFSVGWIWYSLFGPAWLKRLGVPPAGRSLGLWTFALIANLVMAAMLQGVLHHTGMWGVRDGMISAGLLWVGFVLTALGLSEAFHGRPLAVIAIDTGHWLAALLAMGAIVGGFGPGLG